MLISKYTLLLLLPIMLMSCGKDNSVATTKVVQASTEESDPVWVMVNGSPIHQSELDYARHKLLGDQFVDARVEEKGRVPVVWAVHLLPVQKDIVFVRIADIG